MNTVRPKLDIIVVNWNAGAALRECLQSVVASDNTGFELDRVVVVDNASSDGSAKQLHVPGLPLVVIENAENRGFAAACNQGAQNSRADHLLFLNPDTKLFSDTLARSIQWMCSPEAQSTGILGVQLVGEDRGVSRTCARFPKPSMFLAKMFGVNRPLRRYIPEHFYSDWDHKDSRYVDQVMGAYFLVRNPLFQQLDGFDERFFVYFEEVDFSLRAKRTGWNTYFLSSAQCFHRGCGTTDQIKARRLFYSLQSRILYAFKNMGGAQAWALFLATLVIEPLTRIFQGAIRLAPAQVAEVAHGYGLLYGNLAAVLDRVNRSYKGNHKYTRVSPRALTEE
jgi:GT2 family glycosyltransferase